MCRISTALLAFVLFAPAVGADEPKAKAGGVGDKFETLKKSYNEAADAYEKLRRAGKVQEAQAALDKNNSQKHLTKMLELAFFNPSDPLAFDVLFFLAIHGEADTYLWDQVMLQFRTKHASSPKMKHVVRLLNKHTDETNELLRALIASNPDKKVAGLACQFLLDHIGVMMRAAEEVNDKPALKPLIERRAGAEYLKRILTELDKNRKEVKELTNLLADKYKDVLPDLSAGKPLPDFMVEDLGGKKVKSSDLRGKVVVLYLLTTSDEQTTSIVEHQREMTKRLGDRSLALVNVFVDEKKETVVEFLKLNTTPATTGWSAWQDNLLEEWGIAATPSIWILDGKGVIRYRDRYGVALDEVLADLLKESEKK
jgi:hypothetical protein